MTRMRHGVVRSAAAIALLLISTGTALGAVQRATLDPERAPAGTSVALHVETTARIDGTRTGTLFLVPAEGFDSGSSDLHCDEIAGSSLLGEMTWRAASVAFGAGVYDGYVGDATFTVPPVSSGTYYLGENIPARGTGCFVFATFTVTSAALPNTAVPHTATQP